MGSLCRFFIGTALVLGVAVPGAGAQEPTKLKLGVTNGGASVGIMSPVAALWAKEYDKEKLDVTLVNIASGPETVQRMVAGEIEGGVSIGTLPFFQAVASGVDLIWLGSTLQNTGPVMVKVPVNGLSDLNGKRFGSPGVGTIQDTLFQVFEQANGFKTVRAYGRMTDLLGYLERSEIDGVIGWQPTMELARKKLGASYITKSIMPGAQITGIVFPRSYAEKNRDLLLRFLRANLRGIEAYRKDKEAFVEWTAKKEGVDLDVMRTLYLEPDHFWVENPLTDRKSTRILIKAARDGGKIAASVIPTDEAVDQWMGKLIDESLMRQAMSETGFQPTTKH